MAGENVNPLLFNAKGKRTRVY